jgi:hypothetical protein
MANIDAPFGLKPVRHLNGNPWNGQTEKCYVEDDNSNNLFVGDPVIYTGAAGVDVTTGHHKVVTIATEATENRIYGVITSIDPILTDLSKTYLPSTTGGYVNVCVDPDVIFIIQDDGDAVLDGDSVGAQAVLESGTAGSTVTGLSGWEMDTTDTPATDQSNQLLIMAVHAKEGNAFGANCIWEVLISNHILRAFDATALGGLLGI